MPEQPLRVCMFGTYEAGYERNQVLLRGMREAGVEVIECHVPVWERMRYKTIAVKGPLRYATVLFTLLGAYFRLAYRYLRAPRHDVVLVGYLGHFDVFPARILSWLRRKPLVFDAFVSLYDTVVEDRELFARGSLAAATLRQIDRWACKLSDLVLLDTNQHIDYFCEEYGLSPDEFARVVIGAYPVESAPSKGGTTERFVVLHFSKFAPLHGIPFILDAANLLRNDEVVFKIVGGGQTFDESMGHAKRLGLQNLELIDWLEPAELHTAMQEADVCLGIFGDTAKAARVVPNKVYQCLEAGTAVVTGRSPATEELLTDREHVLLCKMADGEAIAAAIRELKNDPGLRERIASGGARLYRERFTPRVIVETELLPHLRRLA